jgi:hypothetical protein
MLLKEKVDAVGGSGLLVSPSKGHARCRDTQTICTIACVGLGQRRGGDCVGQRRGGRLVSFQTLCNNVFVCAMPVCSALVPSD